MAAFPNDSIGLAVRRASAALWLGILGLHGSNGVAAQEAGQRMAAPAVSPIELPMAMERIHPAGADFLIALGREENRAFLVDVAEGRVLAELPLDMDPRYATTFASPDGSGRPVLAVVLQDEGGRAVVGRFAVDPESGFVPLDLPDIEIPQSFRDPAIAYVPFGKGGYSSGGALVVWDRAALPGSDSYLVVWDAKEQEIRAKDYPQHFVPIGSGDWILTLNPGSDRASIVELLGGGRYDNVLVERLGVDAPEQLGIFSPGALYGGRGDIFIANGFSRTLIALSVQDGYPPLIDPPLAIPLDAVPSDRSGGFAPWVLADRASSLILVGALGSDEVSIFRRIRGGIGAQGTLSFGMTVLDATVVNGRSPADPERFVFLGGDGRRLLIVDPRDLQPVEVNAGATSGYSLIIELSAADAGDIARIQRVLASFGYPVGAIDGVAGPRTTAAIRVFQFDNGLDPTGELTEETLAALSVVLNDPSQRSMLDPVGSAYADYLNDVASPEVEAGLLLTLGLSQEDPDHPCFGLNTAPPEALWPFSVKFVRILDRLTADFGFDVQIVSGYRSPAYNRCVGEEQTSAHQRFAAFDIGLADAGSPKESSARLLDALRQLEARGFATIRAEDTGASVHVEPLVGQWHAVVSSYGPNSRGCDAARDDVDEFAGLLAGTDLAGREILVVRTDAPVYAVTVDTNNDARAAGAASELIQKVSGLSGDRRTGADSFVWENSGWTIDPDCAYVRVIR